MMKDVILLKRLNSNDPWVTEDKENLHDVLLTIVSTGKKNISLVSNGKRVKTFLHLRLLSRLKWPAKIGEELHTNVSTRMIVRVE